MLHFCEPWRNECGRNDNSFQRWTYPFLQSKQLMQEAFWLEDFLLFLPWLSRKPSLPKASQYTLAKLKVEKRGNLWYTMLRYLFDTPSMPVCGAAEV